MSASAAPAAPASPTSAAAAAAESAAAAAGASPPGALSRRAASFAGGMPRVLEDSADGDAADGGGGGRLPPGALLPSAASPPSAFPPLPAPATGAAGGGFDGGGGLVAAGGWAAGGVGMVRQGSISEGMATTLDGLGGGLGGCGLGSVGCGLNRAFSVLSIASDLSPPGPRARADDGEPGSPTLQPTFASRAPSFLALSGQPLSPAPVGFASPSSARAAPAHALGAAAACDLTERAAAHGACRASAEIGD
jgi:hypothetical protein